MIQLHPGLRYYQYACPNLSGPPPLPAPVPRPVSMPKTSPKQIWVNFRAHGRTSHAQRRLLCRSGLMVTLQLGPQTTRQRSRL